MIIPAEEISSVHLDINLVFTKNSEYTISSMQMVLSIMRYYKAPLSFIINADPKRDILLAVSTAIGRSGNAGNVEK